MKDFFLLLLMVFYSGPLVPSLVAVIGLTLRRFRSSFTRGFWNTLLVLNIVQAFSYYWYIEATRANDPSALERLWIPYPLGILLFIVASLLVLVYAAAGTSSRSPEGEQDADRKPDHVPS